MLTRTGRVAINTLSNYLRFGTMFLVFMFMTPVMIRGFGADDYGIWTLVFSVTGFFGLFDLGFGTASVKYIAQLSGSKDHERRDRLVGTLSASYIVLALVSALVALALSPFLDGILGLSGAQAAKARILYWILVFRSAVLYLPLSLFRHILYGRQKIWLVNSIQAFTTAAYGIGTVLALRAGGGIIAVAWVNFGVMILEHVLYIVPVLVSKDRPRISPRLADRGEFGEVTSVSMFSFLINLAVLIQMRTDSFIINAIVANPLRAVAVYSVATKIGEYYLLMIKQFGNAISPLVAELKGKGEEGKIRFLLTTGTKYAFLPATVIGVFLLATARPLLLAWVGPDFSAAAAPLIVTVCAIMLTVPEMMASAVLTMTGHHRMTGKAAIAGMLLNVGFSIVFVSMMGIVGAAFGTLAACIIIDLGIILPRVLKLYRIGVPEYAARVIPSVLIPGLVDLAITRLALRFFHPDTLLSLGFAALPGAAACLVIFWFLFVDSAEKELFMHAIKKSGRFQSDGLPRGTAGEDSGGPSEPPYTGDLRISLHWLREDKDWDKVADQDIFVPRGLDPFAGMGYQQAVWRNILGGPASLRLDLQATDGENSSMCTDEAYFVLAEDKSRFGRIRTIRTIDYHATSMDLYCVSRKGGLRVWDALLESRGDIGFETGASLICLYKLADSCATDLEDRLIARKVPYTKQVFNRNFHIRLPEDIDEYWKSKSSKSLYNIRRSERLLSEVTGHSLLTRHFSADDLGSPEGAKALGAFLDLLYRWAEDRAATGEDLSPSAIAAYHRAIFSAWTRDKTMELLVLVSDGKILAGQVNVLRPGRLIVTVMAYDKEHFRFSPGRILFRNFLSVSHARGIRLVELGGEGEDWKKEWATHDVPVWSIRFPIGGWKDALWSLKRNLASLSGRHRRRR